MKHKRYCVVWDNGIDYTDGIECDTIEEAEDRMEDIYHGWAASAISEMMVDGKCSPTPEQIEAWDTMVDEAWCLVVEWSDLLGVYEDTYYGMPLDREKLFEIGWCPWNELN